MTTMMQSKSINLFNYNYYNNALLISKLVVTNILSSIFLSKLSNIHEREIYVQSTII
jgi:hypothetical protein